MDKYSLKLPLEKKFAERIIVGVLWSYLFYCVHICIWVHIWCTQMHICAFEAPGASKSCLPTQETWVRSLGWEDPLEMEMSTHFIILAWRIPLTEEPGGLQSIGLQKESDKTYGPNYMHLFLPNHLKVSCKYHDTWPQPVLAKN